MSLLPNTNPTIFTGSACVIGLLLMDELNASEQNALGNWLILLGQVLETNSAYLQLLSSRNKTDSDECNVDPYKMFENLVCALQEELKNMR